MATVKFRLATSKKNATLFSTGVMLNLIPARKIMLLFMMIMGLSIAGVLSFSSIAQASPAGDNVIITEVLYDTPGTDADEEWVEFYNPTGSAISLNGWILSDNVDSYTLSGTIIAGGYYTVARYAAGFNNLYGFNPDLSGMTLYLGNSGDQLTLKDSGGIDVDFVAWESYVAGWSVSATYTTIHRITAVDTDTVNDWENSGTIGDPGTGDYSDPPEDTTPPVVTITNPSNGATVFGTVSITFDATDANGISSRSILIDGVQKSTGSSYSWDTTTYSDGNHVIRCEAMDPSSNLGFDEVSVTVDNGGTPPERVAGFEGYLYTGQLHNHAGEYGDDGTGTVEDNMNYMIGSATPVLDFGGLSPHSHMVTAANMLSYWGEMNTFTSSTFVAATGQEWSTLSTSNHVNIYLADDHCGVTNGDIPGFYSWLITSNGYGTFNHPWDSSGNDMNNWEYYASADKPGNYAGKMIAMEMKQGTGVTTSFTDYIEALDNGWHIGITVSDDNHDGNPGDKYSNNPRTGMWIAGLTLADVETAFQELRFFGSQAENGYIDLSAGGYTMGDVFTGTNGMTLTAMLNPSFSYTSVEIYVDGISDSMNSAGSGQYTYTINAAEDHYYFIRAQTSSGDYIISSPMWSEADNPPPDTTPPTVAITNPVNAATVSSAVNFAADASDDVAVDYVEFLVDGVVMYTDTVAPYSYSWDTTVETDGSHVLRVNAVDTSSNSAFDEITVTVDNGPPPDTTPPAVTITNPADAATVSDSVSITVDASDDVAVDHVEFLIDGVVVFIDTITPYSYDWDTTTESEGSHTLRANAVDTSTNSAFDEITVTVDNIPPEGDFVLINEFLPAPSVVFTEEWIELYNPLSIAADISGYVLDDIIGGGTAPYTIPGGTVIPAGGYLVFYQGTTGIALNNAGGDTLNFLKPDGVTVLDTYTYTAYTYDESYGRETDGSATWVTFTTPTPGSTNEVTQTDTMHVESITFSTRMDGTTEFLDITVRIVDQNGNPVAGATVTGELVDYKGRVSIYTGQTDNNGEVTFSYFYRYRRALRSGTYTFTVTDVSLSGWTYNPAANIETSDSWVKT
ncbi:MAG: Ig-like domain-containing protein [Candidatus Odinarchaeota archaeon]